LDALVPGARDNAAEAGPAVLRPLARRALAPRTDIDADRAVDLLIAGHRRVLYVDVAALPRRAVAGRLVVRVALKVRDGGTGGGAAGILVVGQHIGPSIALTAAGGGVLAVMLRVAAFASVRVGIDLDHRAAP